MGILDQQKLDEIKKFINEHKASCLWSFDCKVELDREQMLMALKGIKKRADRQGYIDSRKYLSWL
jgi:hypothetical protein